MELKVTECTIKGEDVKVVASFVGRIVELEEYTGRSYDDNQNIGKLFLKIIAESLAEEYMAQHKMEILKAVSKDDIVNGVQLKMIEQFGVAGQR